MRPEVLMLGGLALITAGAAGLIAMNIWTVPTLAQGRPRAHLSPPVATAPSSPSAPSAVTQPPAPTSSNVPVGDAAAMSDGATDGSMDGTAEEGASSDGSTTRSTDGTVLPAIRFEANSKALNKDLIKNVEPIAAYMRHNFGMKVVLVGHGDAGMDAGEYVRIGRFRAASVLRMLVDYGVSVARIGIELPKVEGERVLAGSIPPGTVEVRIEPRFVEPKKGEGDGP